VIEPELYDYPVESSKRIEWEIDVEERVVRPTVVAPPLSKLSIPLRPTLGCFGVAPPRGQFLATSVASNHGGNMDYNRFCEGVTVYLPIFSPGAFFFLGDGHAAQGDGEVTGSGIEVSEEVTFRVSLNKGWEIQWPRAQDEHYIMTVGSTRPLDGCVRYATTEMLEWLVSGFGLDLNIAHTLIGHGVEYDIANMFSLNYTVVCKIAKKTLESVGIRFDMEHTQ
jgi:acetamidase/formamidase